MKTNTKKNSTRKKERPHNMWTMTYAMKKSMIISPLRKLSHTRWLPIKEAKKRNKIRREEIFIEKYYDIKTKKIKDSYRTDIYKCELCKQEVPEKIPEYKEIKWSEQKTIKLKNNVEVDHIIPVVSEEWFNNFHEYIERMFDEDPENYRLLCKSCHRTVTNEQNKNRLQ